MAGLTPQDKQALSRFTSAVRTAFPHELQQLKLFGSKARGDARKHSDIDVLVVLGADKNTLATRRHISAISSDVLLDTGVVISPKVFSQEQYHQLRSWGEPLLLNIEREGIAL